MISPYPKCFNHPTLLTNINTPYCPHQNEKVKKENMTIIESMHNMLYAQGLNLNSGEKLFKQLFMR
jgi:hypothetical protein